MEQASNPLEILQRKGWTLPPAPAPAGLYQPSVRQGQTVYISGMLPLWEGQLQQTGSIDDSDVEEGREAARFCLRNALAVLQKEAGEDFGQLEQILFLQGYVWGVEGFSRSPEILNAASEMLNEAFGERGRHARAAVSVNGLPKEASVEISLIAALR
ncbi:MAG: RidA family protein [Opitutales bacterium]|nr:RidA family protein [Opitutales bacterium]MCH8540469.1 RidA family protein [Opitutales bacterium]